MDHTTFLKNLRQAGHRLTPQREMILTVICESRGHVRADEILTRVRTRYSDLNKSAVYRTLDLLTRLNLVHPTDLVRAVSSTKSISIRIIITCCAASAAR